MGRSSQEQAAKNRAKIVETANHLFRKCGVDNVSVAEVMGATGLTSGGFYKHFASKEGLVREAFFLAFQQALAAWHRLADAQHEGLRVRADAIVRHYFQKRPPDRTCPMLAFAPHVASEAATAATQEAYRQGAEELHTLFLDHVRASRADGNAAASSDREAEVLFAAMVGAGFLARATGDAAWVRSLQDAIVDAALRPRR